MVSIISGSGVIYYIMIEKVIRLNENIAHSEMQIQQLQKTMPDKSSLQEVEEQLLRVIRILTPAG